MFKTLFWRRGLALCSFAFLSAAAYAQKTPQQLDNLRQRVMADPKVANVQLSEERQTPSLILLKNNPGYTRDQAQTALRNYLTLRAGTDELLVSNTQQLPNNVEVLEFQQYFKGLKVEHATFKALVKNGVVQFFNGAWFDVPATLATKASLNEGNALNLAKARVGAKKYAWEEVQQRIAAAKDSKTKDALQKELTNVTPKGELVIVQDFAKKGVAQTRLAYKLNVYAVEPLSRSWIYVDAQDGKVLLLDKIIKHFDKPTPPASVSATVKTRYAGTQIIKTKQISGNDPNSGFPLVSSHPTSEPTYLPGSNTYVLIDDTRGSGVETYDLNGVGGLPISVPGLYTQGKAFTDVDNNWTTAEHHRSPGNDGALEAENDDIAWDAHWGAEVVYDYWKVKHNRLSYDGKNGKIKSFIHYGPAYDNAFWDGAEMTYGDGSGTINPAGGFHALTSLDVCGHEIGHGVCSSTADLVYQGESGAMNEGLSDIWAACIEHFSMVRSGSTVPSTAYRPFYIGEQISASPDNPLRRMDNPKAQSNPDTYGGTNWQDPNCSPNLVNDECGVHTNSGVLNHWFFLLTAGSKLGTRPAGMTANQYYFADSDDEVNDNNQPYRVNGVGFDVSENIVFLTETMLTSTATYAEARAVSIQVATSISGNPCSALVESVTNAWYACGVGAQFVKPCTVKYGFIYQPGTTVSEGTEAQGCNTSKTVNIPVLLPANSTATVATSGTAIKGKDYNLSATTLSNTTAAIAKQNLTVTILNDGFIEPDETINLKLTITNVGTNPVNANYMVTVTNDDVTPIIGNSELTLLNQPFTRADGFADPTGWQEILGIPESNGSDPTTTTGKNQWGIFGNQLAVTGKLTTIALPDQQLPNGTYNNLSESNTIIRTPLLDARGLSLLNITFNYTVQGEVDPTALTPDIENLPALDYMVVVYSLDGVNFTELNTGDFGPFASLTPKSDTFSARLPVTLSNKQFYLGFRWRNDANAGGPTSVQIDNLLIKGSPRIIENDPGHYGSENLLNGYDVYYYSVQQGEVLGRLKNTSTKDYGCTKIAVERSGLTNTPFNVYQSAGGTLKAVSKVMRITATNVYDLPSTVTLYYKESQIKALETATGHKRSEFSLYQIDAGTYTAATPQNTTRYVTTYSAISGVGGTFTINLPKHLNGSYALGYFVPASAPVTQLSGNNLEETMTHWQFSRIYPNPGREAATLEITAPKAQKVGLEVVNAVGQLVAARSEQLSQGLNKVTLPVERLSSGAYLIRFRDAEGNTLHAQQFTHN